MSKGSWQRPGSGYASGYDRIFGKSANDSAVCEIVARGGFKGGDGHPDGWIFRNTDKERYPIAMECRLDGRTTMFQATHKANPVSVNAATILDVSENADSGELVLRLSDGRNYQCDTSLTVRHYPAPGDYLVTQEDGYEYLNPKDVFERKYSAIQAVHDSDCSLHNEPAMPAGPCDCSVSQP